MKHLKALSICPVPCGCNPTWWCETVKLPIYAALEPIFCQLFPEQCQKQT